MSTGPHREFVPVPSGPETTVLLKEAVKTNASTIIWTKNQEGVYNTHLSALDEKAKTLHAAIPPDSSSEMFHEAVKKSGIKDCFFSISLSRANVFFKVSFVGYDSGFLRFSYPESVYKVQRRENFRLPIPDGYTVYAEFQDPLFQENRIKKRVIDISAGGFSFLVAPSEDCIFESNTRIRNIMIRLKDRPIVAEGCVRHVKTLPSNFRVQGTKVGVVFEKIKPQDVQFIAAYVFEESRKYVTKFL